MKSRSLNLAAEDEVAALRRRLRGLGPKHADLLRRVMRDMAQGDLLMAGQRLLELAAAAPDHPEVLRWRGARHAATAEWDEAVACLIRTAQLRPGDFALLVELARAQEQSGGYADAEQTLQSAMRSAANGSEWLALSIECDRQGQLELALQAIEQALAVDAVAPVPLLQRARCLHALGRAEGAAADCRALIKSGQLVARAWFTLLDLKTVRLLDGELAQLTQAAAAPALGSVDRQLLEFALGKALEDAGEYAPALAALHRANQVSRTLQPWDSEAFAQHVQRVQSAFETAPPEAAIEQGAEVIFLVGLPRSGTTLIEQVLASHSRVEGASELPYLGMVVDEESRRRGQAFPAWVASASADDWARLGQRYLQLSARWRQRRPVATDKLPENWVLAGAAMAMLPQARVIDCRRDAVETCWSCYKQLFGPQRVGFTYGFDSLAAYWRAYDGLCRFWAQRHPQRFRAQGYEALVADPEGEIRALLAFCGIPFEPDCLHFHTAQRAIRTPSALQVRQPLQRVSTPAAGYGDLLDPLRQLFKGAPPA